jgi:hypothetical protein
VVTGHNRLAVPAALALRRSTPPDPRQFQRCLLLAVLLHVWLVLVFGNATGTAEPGQGVWGSLTVKLLGRSGGEPGAPPGEPAPEWRDNGAPGDGNPQRQGGQARATAPDTPQTGAAELGRWNPRDVAPEAARTEDLSNATPSTATLNLPEGFKPVERENLSTPAARTTPMPPTAAELPAAVGRLEARPDTTVAPLPAPAALRAPDRALEVPTLPSDLPATVNRLDATAPPARAATLPRPAELRATPPQTLVPPPTAELPAAVQRLEAPTPPTAAATLPRPSELRAAPSVTAPALPNTTSLPASVQRLEAPTQPAATAALPRPSELRAAPSTPAPDLPTSTPLPSAVQRLDTAPANAAVQPLNRANELRTPAATANAAATPSTLPNGQDLPAPVRRLEAADSAGSVTPLQPTTNPRASLGSPGGTALPDLSTALPGQVNAPAGPARGDPSADPFAAPKASAGSPNAGSRLGADVAVPPSASASAPRAPLNLSLPRSGDIAARRGPGLIEMLPQPPERKSKLEQSIEDAANKDCRKAYANAGILAAIPLAVDAARGKGCKW